MTRVEIFLTDKGYSGFTVRGHSGYAGSGHDIVCASVSSVVSFAASLIEESGREFTFESDEESAFVSLKLLPDKQSDLIISVMSKLLSDISADYGKFLSVTVKRC